MYKDGDTHVGAEDAEEVDIGILFSFSNQFFYLHGEGVNVTGFGTLLTAVL